MAIPGKDGKARDRLRKAFAGRIQAKGLDLANTSSYFQQAGKGIDSSIFFELMGSPDEFLKNLAQFEQDYFAALDKQLGRIRGNKRTVNMIKKRGIIDLTLLDYETSNQLATQYKTQVLKLDKIFQKVGLPAYEMPSANLYRALFQFAVDNSGGIQHPAQILYNSAMLNFNPDRPGLESINLNRSNILGSRNLANIFKQFETAAKVGTNKFDMFAGMKDKKILMFDSETTGVDIDSQVRSLSLRELTIDSSGQVQYQVKQDLTAFDTGFNSPKFAGYKVSDLNGGTKSLNEFIAGMEGYAGKDMGEGGQVFLDEAAAFLERLNEADAIAGHNIFFDIKMITDTMAAQSGLGQHERAKKALSTFENKIGQEGYVIDTLEYARAYFKNQVDQAIDGSYNADVIERSAKFVNELMAQETLAKVHIGGSAGYASVENIALNTNLFELIEKSDQASDLFDVLKKGSHIAETDVHLQSFIAKYISRGELKIKSLFEQEHKNGNGTGSPFTEFGNWARSIISRSSAVTTTTNMADVTHMHRSVIKYLKSDEGLRQMQVRVGYDDIAAGLSGEDRLALLGQPVPGQVAVKPTGILSNVKGQYVFTTEKGSFNISNQVDAKQKILNIIDEALLGDSPGVLRMAGVDKNVNRNRAAESIIDTGVSYAQNSRVIKLVEMAGRTQINVGTSIDINDISEAMGSIYRNLGTGLGPLDQTRYLLGIGAQGSVFQRGIQEIDVGTRVSMAESFAKIQDPYANILDEHSRVFSTILAEATADIGGEAGRAAVAAKVQADLVAHTAHSNLLSGYGVSYFKSQEVTRLFDAGTETRMPTSKPMVPLAFLKEAMEKADKAAVEAGLSQKDMFSGRALRVSLSSVQELGRINAAVDVAETFSRDEAIRLAHSLIGMVKDSEVMARYTKEGVSDTVASDMAKIASETDTDKLAETLADYMLERNLVVGKVEGKAFQKVYEARGLAEGILDNDARSSITFRILDSSLTEDYFAVGPGIDTTATRMAEVDLNAAEEVVDLGNGAKESRIINAVRNAARTIDETEGAAKTIGDQLIKDKYGLPENKLMDFLVANKTGIKATAIGVAVAGLAYYVSKRHREASLYDETLAQQPTEPNRGQTRSFNQQTTSQSSFRPINMDPLSTAGVVGNMDRAKIGHGQMGKNKYNHLYGG